MKILIVDDEKNIRSGLKKYIERLDENWIVSADATNGKEALEVLSCVDVDVMLLDINMPVMTGIEVMDELKQRTNFPIVIILSAHSEFAIAKVAIQFGVLDYLLKPINLNELKKCLLHASEMVREKQMSREIFNRSGYEDDYNDFSLPVQLAIKYILKHYSEDITLDDVAKYSCVHPVYMSTLFKKEVKVTVINFLLNHRMKIAKALLIKTKSSINTIAGQVGYKNQHYFSNVFKKSEGCTPSEYRRNKEKQ